MAMTDTLNWAPVTHEMEGQARGAGNSHAALVHVTEAQADERARQIAQNQESELLVHGRNGQIREGDSYGGDPFPPEG